MPKITEKDIEQIIEELPQPRWRAWLRLSISIALTKFGGDMTKTEEWLGLEKNESKVIMKRDNDG